MKIRRASTEDVETLTRIALDAKRHWGYPDHWIRHWQNDLTITPAYVNDNQVFLAENETQIIGFYALTVSGGKAELDHMWVAPAHMGTGVGKELFIHAMQRAAAQNIPAVDIIADPNAEGFYQKMGAYRVGETISKIDGQQRVLPRLTVDPKSS